MQRIHTASERAERPGPDHAPLGAVHFESGSDVDRILRIACRQLREGGAVVAGVVQNSIASGHGCCGPMNLVDLRTGRTIGISQDLGPHARGCRLDERGLAEAAAMIAEAIAVDVDLVVLNRFGKAEAEGGGLMSCISDVIGAGIPVLTAVREPYLDAWRGFHGGLATDLPPSPEAVLAWYGTMARPAATATAGG